jgi:Clathrin propeller repeat.
VANEASSHQQTLESDHYVCVRQKLETDDKPQVIIVNLKNNNEVMRRPINADSAIMHWSKNIIALKAQGRTVQIFDLEAKQKLKSAVMNEDIAYWKWFSDRSLGLVTDNAVYHWDVYDATQQNPVKMFDRLPNLAVRALLIRRFNAIAKYADLGC